MEYMLPYRDDPCPARLPGLAHYADHPDYICADCEMQCLIETVAVDAGRFNNKNEHITADHTVVNIGEAECVVDHSSLVAPLVLGDDGLRWSHCPNCNTQVEGKFAKGEAAGPAWGPGRTGSPRQQTHDQAAWAYMRWFYVESGRVAP